MLGPTPEGQRRMTRIEHDGPDGLRDLSEATVVRLGHRAALTRIGGSARGSFSFREEGGTHGTRFAGMSTAVLPRGLKSGRKRACAASRTTMRKTTIGSRARRSALVRHGQGGLHPVQRRGGTIRRIRSSSPLTGLPYPSRFDVVTHRAPSGASTTARRRP